MADAYLATPAEVAERLKQTAKGRGDTILHQSKTWTSKAAASGTVDAIPEAWRFAPERIEQLFAKA